MYPLLSGLRIIEGASFIAAPLCGLTFAQLGAEVIRFDQIGGGLDYGRWPVTAAGVSLYWEGLNKGKKSVALDLSRPQGRELAAAIVTAPGDNAGLFITNYPSGGFLAHERLLAKRADLITLRVTGSSDGSSALDYTINSATGYPWLTGPAGYDRPVNNVLPAWDISCGLTAAVTLLSAERARRAGTALQKGGEIRIALSDIAFATLGNLGQIAEVQVNNSERSRIGNDLFGAFGRDFKTRDGRFVMICAITRKQWQSLLDALTLTGAITALQNTLGVDFAADEGQRFEHREPLYALVAQQVAKLNYAECAGVFEAHAVCWGPYRTVRQALAEDKRLSTDNPLFANAVHPSGTPYLTPGFPAAIDALPRQPVGIAPRLGQHTEQVLSDVLGLPSAAIGRLIETAIVAQSADPT